MTKNIFLIIVLGLAFFLCGEDLMLKGWCNASKMSYKLGETAEFYLQLFDGEKKIKPDLLKYKFHQDGGWIKSGTIRPVSTAPVCLQTTLYNPGVVRLEVYVCNSNGDVLKRNIVYWGSTHKMPVKFDGGAVFGLEKIVPDSKEPADFDQFWQKQLHELSKIPLRILKKSELKSPDPLVRAWEVKISCAGDAPVSGILTMPCKALKHSLPAEISFQGYGVRKSNIVTEKAKNKIYFNVNAHGIDNLREKEYYQKLSKGKLKRYGLNNEGLTPEQLYFRNMLLRAVRATQYIQTLPEWNQRDLKTSGHSQGGFQAIAAAALSPKVSSCFADMPWLSNLEGPFFKHRLNGWYPQWTPAFKYFDSVHFAKRLRGELDLQAGMGDYDCTPFSIICIFKNTKAPVTLTILQGIAHNKLMQNCSQRACFSRNK